MKRAVITGPTGAIGMALITQCIQEGWEVLAVCHRGSARISSIPVHPRVKILETELSELGQLEQVVEGRYDVFYHFAWEGTTGAAPNDIRLQTRNIASALQAAELAAKLGCNTFVGAGSQAEYGRTEQLLSPETPVFPENGYGMAKLCAGQMSRIRCQELGIKHVWVRILSVYGPFDGPNTMVSATLRKLLCGEHVAFTPAAQQWDYLYRQIHPLREYIVRIREAVCERIDTLRVQEGQNKYLKAGSVGIGELPYPKGQVMFLGADLTELTNDTGFVPEVDFEEGIRRTIDGIIDSVYNGDSAVR